MTHSEFVEWQFFAEKEPFGGRRGDVQAAMVATTVANAHRDAKKRKKPFGVAEFMPEYWAADGQSERESQVLMAKVMALNAAFGGADERKR